MPVSQYPATPGSLTSATRIGLIYLVFSGIWIYVGDRVLLLFSEDPAVITRLQTHKGLLFVILSAALIFVLVRQSLSAAQAAHDALSHEKALFKTIIDTIPIMITRYDPDANMLYLNKEFERKIGWSTEDARHANVLENVYPDPAYRQLAFDYMQAATTEWREFAVQSKTGKKIISEWSNIRIDDGTRIGIGLDITERKAAESALQQKNEEMERFVYSVSHDLKSPLITVQSFLGLLRQDIAAGNMEQTAADIDFIHAATDKIDKLLAALLQLSRVGQLESSPETMTVDTLISECLAALAGAIQQRKIAIEVADIPLRLYGDPLRLGQIWQNLIENAIKYMGDQAAPRIEIGVERKEGETHFFVRDNGIGIIPEQSERIFGIFTQLDPRSEGSGLGLALVKKIVELYGGGIRVESAGMGQGSCFYFTLPQALRG